MSLERFDINFDDREEVNFIKSFPEVDITICDLMSGWDERSQAKVLKWSWPLYTDEGEMLNGVLDLYDMWSLRYRVPKPRRELVREIKQGDERVEPILFRRQQDLVFTRRTDETTKEFVARLKKERGSSAVTALPNNFDEMEIKTPFADFWLGLDPADKTSRVVVVEMPFNVMGHVFSKLFLPTSDVMESLSKSERRRFKRDLDGLAEPYPRLVKLFR